MRILFESLDGQSESHGFQYRVLVEHPAHASVVFETGLNGAHAVHVDCVANIPRFSEPYSLLPNVVAVPPSAVNDDDSCRARHLAWPMPPSPRKVVTS